MAWLRDQSSRYSMKSSSEASAHCMSSNDITTGSTSAMRSKKSRHAAKRSSLSRAIRLLEPDEMGEAGLDPLALLGIGDVLLDRGVQLRRGRGGVLALQDAGTSSHHLGERPVGDALAVGQAAPPVPEEHAREAVHVLVELPGEAALADAGDAGHRDEVGPRLLGRGVEEVLDEAELAVAPDERRLEALGLERAADAGDDAERLVEPHRLGLALQLVDAGVGVDDRGLGRPAGRLVHIAASRRRDGLDPRRGVDAVADDEALLGRLGRRGRARSRRRPGPRARPEACSAP